MQVPLLFEYEFTQALVSSHDLTLYAESPDGTQITV